jgi:hypothetical protein
MSIYSPHDSLRPVLLRRLSVATVAALFLLLLSTTGVFAQDEPVPPTPVDRLCVEGTVINHAEEPLADWTVQATYEGTEGDFPAQTTTTDDEGRFRFILPGPGRWAFEVEMLDGWEEVTADSLAVRVVYGSPACIDIRFKVRRLVMVRVHKIDDVHTPLAGWTITATPGPGNTFASVQTAVTDADGIAYFDLTPGEWIFTEAPPAGVEWWEPISPPTGMQTLDVAAPGPYDIRFKNIVRQRLRGCIDVIKRDVPPDPNEPAFGLAGWEIQVLRANGSVAASGVTDAFGAVSFDNLPFGPYRVREIMQPGWEAASPTIYDVVLTSRDEDCQAIAFFNRQTPKGFCIEGRKVDANGKVGIPNWVIRATPVDDDGVTPERVLTDGTGRFRIDLPLEDYRIPGAQYQVCEVVANGWTAVGPTCYTVTIPEHEGLCVQTPDFVNRQTRYEGPGAWAPGPGRDDPPAWGGTCRTTHIVKRGESVYRIASMYHVPAQQIFQANPWIYKQRNRWLYVGQEICIP